MEPKNLLNCSSRAEFREWLAANHAAKPECWIAVQRGRPRDDGTFWYLEEEEWNLKTC